MLFGELKIYQCQRDDNGHPGQQAQPGGLEQLNTTFSDGGPACLWRTLEQVTRIHIDHFVMVNFEGFKSIVNDVGGVPVCLPYAIKDPASKLNLPAGKSVVHGDQALAFVRERHIGLDSDLQRINRQQIFLASLAQKIKQSSSLANPTKLYGLVHDIASSLTTDSGLTLTNMYAIANSLKGLSTKALQFSMAPVVPYPADPTGDVIPLTVCTTVSNPRREAHGPTWLNAHSDTYTRPGRSAASSSGDSPRPPSVPGR